VKICITSEGNTLESKVDPRFGRCAYFMIVNTETGQFEVLKNDFAVAGGGAGIQSGQFMVSNGVKAVLTGNVGPNAFQTLLAAGVEIYTGVSGTIREAVEKFKSGNLKAEKGPSVDSHFGMNK